MPEDWLDYLKKAWLDSLKAKEVNKLSMLLRDLVAYGRQTESIDEAFALDIAKRIEVLEQFRSIMSPGEISKAIRSILYAKRHTAEAGTDYGSGFRHETKPGHGDTAGEADEPGITPGRIAFGTGNGLRISDLDDDYAEMD